MIVGAATAQDPEALQQNAPAAAVVASPVPTAEQIAGWIAQLADNNYNVRQEAAERLLASGFAARAALLAVADGPDPEVRATARRLVTMIEQSEFSRRLAEFAADTDGHRGVTLPGWEEFSELVGDDASARALFVEMQREDAVRLEALFSRSTGERDFRWEERATQLNNLGNGALRRGSNAPAARFATMLFLGSLPDAQLPDGVATRVVLSARQPPISEALASQNRREQNMLRKLLAAWVIRCDCRSEGMIEERLNLVFLFDLKEALLLALKIVGEPRYLTANPQPRMLAVLAVGRFGSAENIAALEPLLADESELMQRPNVNLPQLMATSVQMRDVALATILHLAGQNLQDFGFVNPRRHELVLFEPASLGFDNGERRASALAKWQSWKAEHKSAPATTR